jgi:uncharacterized protein with HEPN domain
MVRLHHMLDHAKEALTLAHGKTYRNLAEDRVLQLALARLVQIIGEAAYRVPKEERDKYSAILWQDIASMRHRLVHDYDIINIKTLWDTIQDDLPPLIAELEKIVPPDASNP